MLLRRGTSLDETLPLNVHDDSGKRAHWNRLSVIIMAAGLGALLSAALLFVLTLAGIVGDGTKYSGPGTVTAFGNIYDLPRAQPTATLPPPSNAALARIVIPQIEVDAPISIKAVDANGVMETPDGPWDVAWYDFTARPGFGSNAVFSGHLDYVDVGPAVFWRLRELAPNDLVEVRLEDGTVYQYQVVAMDTVDAETVDVGKIVGPTEQEMVTLITCAGTFDPTTRQYDQRLIVRANRVYGTPAQEPPLLPSGAAAGP